MPFIARCIVADVVVAGLGTSVTQAQSASTGSGQAFPTRPIRFLVPVPAGEFGHFVKAEMELWGNGARKIGMKPD